MKSKLYSHPDYPSSLNQFNTSNSSNRWTEFKSVHLKVTNYKCPICECPLKDNELLSRNSHSGQTTIKASIDHYRPKDPNLYPFLKYEHTNYLLMCSECNNVYKGCEFPLYPDNTARATCVNSTSIERPLIINPIYDDIFDLLEIKMVRTLSGKKVLELIPKHNSGYKYEKAKETIRLFSLSDCETQGHTNYNVKSFRISLLHMHFKKFEGFMLALENNDIQKMKSEISSKKLEQFGFFQFFIKRQYKNLVSS